MDSTQRQITEAKGLESLRDVLGQCVDRVSDADAALSLCASILEDVLVRLQIVEALTKPRSNDAIKDLCKWLEARQEIQSQAVGAIEATRKLVKAFRADQPQTHSTKAH
jgi:hypothetical protein